MLKATEDVRVGHELRIINNETGRSEWWRVTELQKTMVAKQTKNGVAKILVCKDVTFRVKNHAGKMGVFRAPKGMLWVVGGRDPEREKPAKPAEVTDNMSLSADMPWSEAQGADLIVSNSGRLYRRSKVYAGVWYGATSGQMYNEGQMGGIVGPWRVVQHRVKP